MEITGFDNYLIYPDGKVFSKKRKKYLTAYDDGFGYLCVSLNSNKKRLTPKIHRLVGKHYIPNPENKPQLDHINRDKTDNRVENLRWVSVVENAQNKGNNKRNTSGHKNISYNNKVNKWAHRKQIDKKQYLKYFDTLEEAVDFKHSFDLKNKIIN